MACFLLAWELGDNFGHVAPLRALATELQRRGHHTVYALRDVIGPRGLLADDPSPVLPAPVLLKAVDTMAWTMADILLACGYASPASLGGLAGAWKDLIACGGCDAVIADHAPTALLAARLAGKPALHVGNGFCIPPRGTPLPAFRDWAAPPTPSHVADAEARALAAIDAVLAAHGRAPLPCLDHLFHPEGTLLCTWPEIDHYAAASRPPASYCGPLYVPLSGSAAPEWPDVPGPRVFAYLRAAYPGHAELLRALDARGCATLCVMPDLPEQVPVASARIAYTRVPRDMAQVLRECDALVSYGGHATVAQALHAGVPCLLAPNNAEQFIMARRAESAGVGLNAFLLTGAPDHAGLVARLVDPDGATRAAARALGAKYRDFDPARLPARIASAAEALLGG